MFVKMLPCPISGDVFLTGLLSRERCSPPCGDCGTTSTVSPMLNPPGLARSMAVLLLLLLLFVLLFTLPFMLLLLPGAQFSCSCLLSARYDIRYLASCWSYSCWSRWFRCGGAICRTNDRGGTTLPGEAIPLPTTRLMALALIVGCGNKEKPGDAERAAAAVCGSEGSFGSACCVCCCSGGAATPLPSKRLPLAPAGC